MTKNNPDKIQFEIIKTTNLHNNFFLFYSSEDTLQGDKKFYKIPT